MTTSKSRVAAVDGWFTMDGDSPTLLGSRCASCGNLAFPKETFFCRNPRCDGQDFTEEALSRTGTIWSYTNAVYQPPDPYVPADPHVPFAIVAVELGAEQMVVMGQVVPGIDVADLSVGAKVELVVDTLYEDEEHEYVVWKWRPTGAAQSGEVQAGV